MAQYTLADVVTAVKDAKDEFKKDIAGLSERLEPVEKAFKNQPDLGLSGVGSTFATARDPRAELSYGYSTPTEFLLDVMKVYQENTVTKRMGPLLVKNIQKAQREKGIVTKAAGSDEQSGINDPYGGIMVPPAFSPDLLKLDPE